MRHGKKFNHLSRKAPHRKAMLANMASSLVKHKRINTTVTKAKALRTFIEPLLTRSKEDTTHSRRMVFRYLRDKFAVTELFRDVAPKITDRPGGYTRILKTGNRLGDNAEMCVIELVDFNEALLAEPKSTGATAKKPRTRRGRKKGGDAPKADASAEASQKEETKQDSKPVVEDAEIIEEEASTEAESKEEEKAEAKEETSTEEVAEEETMVEEAKEEKTEEPAKDDKAEESEEEESKDEGSPDEDEEKKN